MFFADGEQKLITLQQMLVGCGAGGCITTCPSCRPSPTLTCSNICNGAQHAPHPVFISGRSVPPRAGAEPATMAEYRLAGASAQGQQRVSRGAADSGGVRAHEEAVRGAGSGWDAHARWANVPELCGVQRQHRATSRNEAQGQVRRRTDAVPGRTCSSRTIELYHENVTAMRLACT